MIIDIKELATYRTILEHRGLVAVVPERLYRCEIIVSSCTATRSRFITLSKILKPQAHKKHQLHSYC